MPSRLAIAASIVVLLLGAHASPALAGVPDDPGRVAYLRYCGACHGPQGRGDGIAGTYMNPKPANLTEIAKKNGGVFPFTKTMQFIDGTTDVRAHGDPDMPVWGQVFRDQATLDSTRRIQVRGELLVITDYLQSIQQK
jgi:hypothetical protein